MQSHFKHIRPQLLQKRIQYSTPYPALLIIHTGSERQHFPNLLEALPVLGKMGTTLPPDKVKALKRDLGTDNWIGKLTDKNATQTSVRRKEMVSFSHLFSADSSHLDYKLLPLNTSPLTFEDFLCCSMRFRYEPLNMDYAAIVVICVEQRPLHVTYNITFTETMRRVGGPDV